MIAVPGKVLRRELPVARHNEFVHAANDLDATLVPVEESIEIPGHFAEILAQRGRFWIEGGEPQALVAVELRHRNEAPALAVQFAVIGLFEIRDPSQLPVIAIGPAMISAGKTGGIAGLGAAQPVAAVAAD